MEILFPLALFDPGQVAVQQSPPVLGAINMVGEQQIKHFLIIDVVRSVARQIVKEDGLGRNGLLGKGITGTMARNGYFNMVKTLYLLMLDENLTGLLWLLSHSEELGSNEPRL